MTENIAIAIILLFLAWFVSKALGEWEKLTTKVQVLERQVRVLTFQNNVGDLWEEVLELNDAKDEVELWEGKLYEAEQKIWGKEVAVAFCQKELARARGREKEAEETYERAKGKATGKKSNK